MFNLLPETEKKLLLHEYRMKLCILTGVFVFFACAIGFFSATPAYLLVELREADTSRNLKDLQDLSKGKEDYRKILKEVHADIAIFNAPENNLATVEIIDRILAHKQKGVQIRSFSLQRKEGGESSVDIQGVAGTREALLSFKKNLEAEKLFTSVDLPVSHLARGSDILFNVHITGKF